MNAKGQARPTNAPRRSPLWTFALVGIAGVSLTSPELALGEAMLASGRAAAHGSEVLIASARAAVQSAADLIRKRSPGTRTSAHLIKVKYARRPVAVARAKPRLRAPAPFPAFLAPPPEAVPLAFSDTPFAPGLVPVSDFPVGPIGGGPAPCLCNFAYIPPIIGGGGVVIGGGGGGGGGGTVPGNPNPPAQPPGVPEPQNWALMIMGFAAIGAAWRRRRVLLTVIKAIPLLTYAPLR